MITAQPLTVVIAGGGTGGHFYPGLAVAREIVRRVSDARVSFAGTARGIEARLLPHEGFELDLIRSAGLRGKSPRALLRGLGLVPLGLLDAWRLLSKRRPHVVVGVGGYSAGPVVLVASEREMPTMVLEQNAVPGLTNRLLAYSVKAAAVNFDSALPFFRGKGFVAGNPVRAEFLSTIDARTAVADAGRPAQTVRILVIGGSQGAHAINGAMPRTAAELRQRAVACEIVHQTGERDLVATRWSYQQANLPVRISAFLDPVVDEMRAADLIVCRAGATTLAELAALGKPAVLVPLAARDNHQLKNAEALARAGAAVVVEESRLGGEALADAIAGLVADRDRLAEMSRAMAAFARPDAAARIVDKIVELAALSKVPPSILPVPAS